MKIGSNAWLIASLAALGCGSGEDAGEVPATRGGAAAGSQGAPALLTDEPWLRVDLAGTDADARIVRARLVDVHADELPTPSLDGAAALVGYGSDGTVRVATPFSLPTVLRIEASRDGASPAEGYRSPRAAFRSTSMPRQSCRASMC